VTLMSHPPHKFAHRLCCYDWLYDSSVHAMRCPPMRQLQYHAFQSFVMFSKIEMGGTETQSVYTQAARKYHKPTNFGAFAKFRKATISFVMSVCSSALNTSASTGRIFMKLNIWAFFESPSKILKFHSNLTRMIRTLYDDVFIFMTISR
jgi:hypothetical protein